LGVTTDGVKVPLGLWDGSTENKRVCVELLADLVDRGLDCDQGVLVVLDGGKALRAAIDAVFGHVPVQRCIRHKERNVLDHLPESDRPTIKRKLRAAWKLTDHKAAIGRLEALARELEHSHPGAAASLREGLAETVTLQRLGVDAQLWKTLSSTNPIESMISICRATSRNIKRWQNGDMCLRWTAAGMLEAERQFRKIIGYKHLAALAVAVEADVAAGRAATSRSTTTASDTTNPTEPAATLAAAHWITGSPPRSSTANGTPSDNPPVPGPGTSHRRRGRFLGAGTVPLASRGRRRGPRTFPSHRGPGHAE
jgi:putative transposase